jgi:hypothetical protein
MITRQAGYVPEALYSAAPLDPLMNITAGGEMASGLARSTVASSGTLTLLRRHAA